MLVASFVERKKVLKQDTVPKVSVPLRAVPVQSCSRKSRDHQGTPPLLPVLRTVAQFLIGTNKNLESDISV